MTSPVRSSVPSLAPPLTDRSVSSSGRNGRKRAEVTDLHLSLTGDILVDRSTDSSIRLDGVVSSRPRRKTMKTFEQDDGVRHRTFGGSCCASSITPAVGARLGICPSLHLLDSFKVQSCPVRSFASVGLIARLLAVVRSIGIGIRTRILFQFLILIIVVVIKGQGPLDDVIAIVFSGDRRRDPRR